MTLRHVSDETRARLIAAARDVFAEAGFASATTRRICVLAKANAAAVNYHFGDKLGLYTAVLKSVVGDEQEGWDDIAVPTRPPDLALRQFVRLMFTNLGSRKGSEPYAKLMAHEMSHPTEGLTVVVEQMIRPRALALCAIVGRIIGRSADATLTRICAHSIIAQIVHHIHSRPVIRLLWPDWQMNAQAIDELIDHITDFSLAGLAGVARKTAPKTDKKQLQKTKI